KKAMTYPIAVLVVAIIMTAILLIKVVPQFERLFGSFGADLPAFTQLVIRLSEWLQAWWFAVLIGIAGSILLFKEARYCSQAFSDLVVRTVLKIPVIGDILHKPSIARFA